MTTINLIAAKDGFLFVRLESSEPHEIAGSAGDLELEPVCMHLLEMLELTNELKLRAIVGANTIIVRKTAHGRAALAFPTGHAQSKSASRVLRRALRGLVPTKAIRAQDTRPTALA